MAPPGTIRMFPFIGQEGSLNHERSAFSAPPTYARLAALFSVNIGGPMVLDMFTRGADLFHSSNQVRVAPRNCRLTATIHDLTCWIMPDVHTTANIRADATFAKNVFQRAHGLIAVSENTKYDAARFLNIDPHCIEVIYSGVDELFFTAEPLRRPRPYVLFVGTIEPRKNLDILLDAWGALRGDVREEFDLVLAGPAGWHSERTLGRLQSGVRGVEYLGYVAEAELPSLTAGATVFAYPSLYEGFGFPVAQAMAAGVPVLTSNTSCLPEVVGYGGLSVDPRSPSEITAGLKKLLEDAGLRKNLGAAGRRRASELYRWDECARRSLAFFERAVGARKL
jgi:alpha-1,3-rhamnosyl/mannosyltransferase